VALRLAGYVKSPSFWVTQEQYELIEYMAKQNKTDIDRIRYEAENLPDWDPQDYNS
jgi:hypothetical protein